MAASRPGRPSNRYTTDYPFCPVAVAHLGDSVAYVRAYLLQANCPRPDTL